MRCRSRWTASARPAATSPDLAVAAPVLGGRARVSLQLPTAPSALGTTFYEQAIALAAGANPLGGLLSEGPVGVLGAR